MWSLVRPTGVSKFINLDMISEPCQMLAGLSQVGFAWCCLAAGGGFHLVLSRRRRPPITCQALGSLFDELLMTLGLARGRGGRDGGKQQRRRTTIKSCQKECF